MSDTSNSKILVEITDPREFHCFKLVLNPKGHHPDCAAAMVPDAPCDRDCGTSGNGARLEIMFHATALVDLIHKASLALCEWQRQNSQMLILELTGLSEDEARKAGLIA